MIPGAQQAPHHQQLPRSWCAAPSFFYSITLSKKNENLQALEEKIEVQWEVLIYDNIVSDRAEFKSRSAWLQSLCSFHIPTAFWVNQKKTKVNVIIVPTIITILCLTSPCYTTSAGSLWQWGLDQDLDVTLGKNLHHHRPSGQPRDSRHGFPPAASHLHSLALAEKPPPWAWDKREAANSRDRLKPPLFL